jgi:cob(I)alamin adenosyltransferase
VFVVRVGRTRSQLRRCDHNRRELGSGFMRLYTKTGDDGQTGLIGGTRVSKAHPRVAAYGQVDELNAAVGWSCVVCDDASWRGRLQRIQDRLFVVGARLADPRDCDATLAVSDDDVSELERWIDEACEETDALTCFVLPGGCELACRFHFVRAICRRAEREVVLMETGSEAVAGGNVVRYVNRLADLFFAWARLANRRAGVSDIEWTSPKDS